MGEGAKVGGYEVSGGREFNGLVKVCVGYVMQWVLGR